MKKIFVFLLFFVFLFGNGDGIIAESNATAAIKDTALLELRNKLIPINEKLAGNIWITRYSNYKTFQNLTDELKTIEAMLKKQSKSSSKSTIELQKKQNTIKEQLELLKEFEKAPFSSMITAPEIDSMQKITNPIAVISGFSYIKQLRSTKDEYKIRLEGLDRIIDELNKKEEILSEIVKLSEDETYKNELIDIRQEIVEFKAAEDIAQTTYSVYEKRIIEAISRATEDIKAQMKKAMNIGIFILVVVALSFLFKFIIKKTITDNERLYTANKFINLVNITLIILILLFAYIENVTYIVTVLGFASAGIAIAMKDMFMSMLGWMVIVFGGSFHVGDRIKVRKDGENFVGDIIDISLLRMTIYEDVTFNTYQFNRRAGRIIFIPNNYIFTDLIANFSHQGMKTVWDGIDITLSFESNHKKAVYIIKNIVRKYSKGYTDIAKKQMSKLRNQYSIKNPNVEPRIFSFIEPHGVKISAWYMTNSFAPMALRSTISSEIIESLLKEDDIVIAYPTQTLYMDKRRKASDPKPIENNEEIM
ncbi:mechanosensitive ion channel domain-containing protein [Campylobacter sp. RM16189]|uniref:mechanosensitive ion channel family protein n=1 Tax=Campylobacter sp. RM16189 TaxID=1705726 RepID=UPI001472C161|nr:mechanosensitive ion channel domain-containing protein [Campylobacter sp. RM16189]